jgi:hypothetical protein
MDGEVFLLDMSNSSVFRPLPYAIDSGVGS